jgi:hypothetical protein
VSTRENLPAPLGFVAPTLRNTALQHSIMCCNTQTLHVYPTKCAPMILTINSINRFLLWRRSVSCEVRTGFLYTLLMNFGLHIPQGRKSLTLLSLITSLSTHPRALGSLPTSDHCLVLLTMRGPLEAYEIKPNFIYREAENFFRIT